MHENCSKLCSSIFTFVSHYPVLRKVSFFLAARHFSIWKMKIKMADRKKHVLSKAVKNIIFQNKTLGLLVMFYRHNKTLWYQFCNFKHFLKAENSEDSLASSCEEFSIRFRVTQYETGLLLELATGLLLELLKYLQNVLLDKKVECTYNQGQKSLDRLSLFSFIHPFTVY